VARPSGCRRKKYRRIGRAVRQPRAYAAGEPKRQAAHELGAHIAGQTDELSFIQWSREATFGV